jgi:signal transduction histidine kinase/ligand-binding sensor domain-containing protein
MTAGRALVISLLLAPWPRALALNPALDVNQYAHTSWKIRDGFVRGIIYSIAQTPDGYLWLGTEYGLLRFDGVKTTPWEPPQNTGVTIGSYSQLLGSPDGTLWIGTDPGLASWKDGKLKQFSEFAGRRVSSLLQDHSKIWAASDFPTPAKLCAIQNGSAQCSPAANMVADGIASLFKDTKGSLWVGNTAGVWRWDLGPASFIRDLGVVQALAEDDDGQLLIAATGGLERLVNGKPETAYRFPSSMESLRADRAFRDRDGGLWVGSRRGVVHFHRGTVDVFAHHDGLSGDHIYAIFEDREGSIWIATENGLDRFRDYAIPSLTTDQGLSNASITTVLAARDGSVWIGTLDGLNHWDHGLVTIYREKKGPALPGVRQIVGAGLPDRGVHAIFQDRAGRIWISDRRAMGYLKNDRFIAVDHATQTNVQSIVADKNGDVWIATDDALRHVKNDQVAERIPWTTFGHQDPARPLVADPVDGLWLGFFSGGIAHFAGGKTRESYAASDGLGRGRAVRLRMASDRTLWASTEGGLSRIKDGHIMTLNSTSGLPCDSVFWSLEDNTGSLWLSMPCGLVSVGRSDLEAWISSKVPRVHTSQFDTSDGVRISAGMSTYSPVVDIAPDGKLWFRTMDGVGIIDPGRLAHNNLRPPVHIEQMTADGKVYGADQGMRLPPLVRDLSIQFTALSLAAPEKMQFRYKLEGQDPDWRAVGNDRRAQYSNLAPRRYRFRVIASNNSGVWNEAGDSLEFSIAAAYYQTTWFRASVVAAFFVLLWALYRLRLYQIAREFNLRLEERLNERYRLARDLHDTLLQSFQGLMLRFQVVDDLLPEGKAKDQLEQALERADQAIVEGRSALHDLRVPAKITGDLPEAVRALFGELAPQDSAEFRFILEGETRELHPIVRDELYRIIREALRNAFRHARARRIETELNYGRRAFRLRIRDDGNGIPPEILEHGRPEHYGLSGMRERARQIGAKFTIWSGVGTGTEIELKVASAIAYGAPGTSLLQKLLALFSSKRELQS